MNRLTGFDNTFVNIVLTLVLTLVITYLMFPNMISTSTPRDWSKWLLAGGLSVFIVKYLHESSVASHRFGRTTFQNCLEVKWQVLLFFSRCLVPLLVCCFSALFLLAPTEMSGRNALISGVALILLHAVLYWIPDCYLKHAKPKLTVESYWRPDDVINRWLQLDRYVIYLGFSLSVIIVAVFLMNKADYIEGEIKPQAIKLARALIGSVMIGQSLVDWVLNRHYFFKDNRIDTEPAFTRRN